eukprot:COSAG01_NODE_49385_length_372_cov_1.750916_1_plen_83_part_01
MGIPSLGTMTFALALFKGSGEAWSIWCFGGIAYILLWWGSNLETIWRMHVVTKDGWAADSCWDDVRIGWSYSMASSSAGAGTG